MKPYQRGAFEKTRSTLRESADALLPPVIVDTDSQPNASIWSLSKAETFDQIILDVPPSLKPVRLEDL
ncbi:hypothetical protein ACFV1N_20705 [Streptosporangium canum]|uniref:hypothetical protein n=1 Tax=Streptosporangium canum TaxID=324952 RepID=UPI0036C173DC